MVELEGTRGRSEEVVSRLRAESTARLERTRRRRVTGLCALAAASLAALMGLARLGECRLRVPPEVAEAEAVAKARAAERAEFERKLAALERDFDAMLAAAATERDRRLYECQHDIHPKRQPRHRRPGPSAP
jgi:hypothetical protein